jgi:hypothetical protein
LEKIGIVSDIFDFDGHRWVTVWSKITQESWSVSLRAAPETQFKVGDNVKYSSGNKEHGVPARLDLVVRPDASAKPILGDKVKSSKAAFVSVGIAKAVASIRKENQRDRVSANTGKLSTQVRTTVLNLSAEVEESNFR